MGERVVSENVGVEVGTLEVVGEINGVVLVTLVTGEEVGDKVGDEVVGEINGLVLVTLVTGEEVGDKVGDEVVGEIDGVEMSGCQRRS